MTGTKPAAICMPEIKMGIAMPLPFLMTVKAKLHSNIVTMLMLGKTFFQQEALKAGLIQSLYDGEANLENQIKAFGKDVAFAGGEGRALVMNKLNEYGDVVALCRQWTWSPSEDVDRRVEFKNLNAYMEKQKQLKVKAKAKKAAAQRPKL